MKTHVSGNGSSGINLNCERNGTHGSEGSSARNNSQSKVIGTHQSQSRSPDEVKNILLVEGVEAFQDTLARKKSASLKGANAFKSGLKNIKQN